jgi:hypothetical protein
VRVAFELVVVVSDGPDRCCPLGIGLDFVPQRIDEAVDAPGGNQHVVTPNGSEPAQNVRQRSRTPAALSPEPTFPSNAPVLVEAIVPGKYNLMYLSVRPLSKSGRAR